MRDKKILKLSRRIIGNQKLVNALQKIFERKYLFTVHNCDKATNLCRETSIERV